jgi:hypothetical protein
VSLAAVGIAAAVLEVVSYILYARVVQRGVSKPNGMTWLMWSYGSAAHLFVQLHVGTPTSVLLAPAVGLACAGFVTVHVLRRAPAQPPEPLDLAMLLLDLAILVGYLWHLSRPGVAERAEGLVFVLLPAASAVLTIVPILRTTWRDPTRERPLSWFVAVASEMLVIAAILAEELEWQYLGYPVVSVLGQLAVGALAFRGLRRGKPMPANGLTGTAAKRVAAQVRR